jgi:hypothetical protein
LTARARDPRVHGVVRRALLALAELDAPRFAHEYVSREPRRARPDGDAEKSLRAFARAHSSWSDVWLREGDRGEVHVAILRAGDPAVAIEIERARGPVARSHVPLRADTVHLEPSAGRVAIETAYPHEARALAAAVGRAFFDDDAFFTDRPAFTTRPLEALGTAGLASARLPAPLTRVRVIACTKEIVGEGRRRATGSRALALLEERASSAGGYLPEVTLRFDVAGEEMPVDVEVHLPGRFACSAPRWKPLVREAMAGLGMLAPGALGDDAWSLFPVRHPDWRLRATLGGAEVDALLAAKALRRALSRNVTLPELRAQGSNLLTFPVPGEPGVSYAIPSDPSVAPRDVVERDREVLELDVSVLATLRAKEMRLEGQPRVGEGGAWLAHGVLPARTASLAFVSLLRAPVSAADRKAIVRRIAADVFPAHAVLLVPEGRAWESGLFEVEYRGLVEGGTALVERAVRLARLEDDVDLWRLTHAPLVVHRASRRVWFHGVLLDLPDSGYAFVEGLALHPDRVSSSREVCKWLSPRRVDLQAARATRPKIVKWIASRLDAAAKRVPAEEIERVIVVEGKRGYRLGVPVRVF